MFLHNLLNVLVQIANKMGLQKKSSLCRRQQYMCVIEIHVLIRLSNVTESAPTPLCKQLSIL
jgi:hypothetical protein